MEELIVPYKTSDLLSSRGVLVLAPHPDDEVFGPGGTLALYAAAGIPVMVIVLTDGAYGRIDEDRDQWILLREAESTAAAAMLGLTRPSFWRIPDRELVYSESLVVRILEAIRHSGCDLVVSTALTEMHPDHRVLAMLAIEAVRRHNNARLMMYEIGIAMPGPSMLMDISSTLGRKNAAMACFVSQLAVQRYSEQINALNRFRTYTLPREVQAAEAFLFWDPADETVPWHALYESEYSRRQRLGLLVPFENTPAMPDAATDQSGHAPNINMANLLQTHDIQRLELASSKRQLAEVLESRSWEITSPLRKCAAWARHLFGKPKVRN